MAPRSFASHVVGHRWFLPRALLVISSLIPVVPVAAYGQPSRREVIMYHEMGYRGRGEARAGDWRGGGHRNRRIRSAHVPSGMRVTFNSEPDFHARRRDDQRLVADQQRRTLGQAGPFRSRDAHRTVAAHAAVASSNQRWSQRVHAGRRSGTSHRHPERLPGRCRVLVDKCGDTFAPRAAVGKCGRMPSRVPRAGARVHVRLVR